MQNHGKIMHHTYTEKIFKKFFFMDFRWHQMQFSSFNYNESPTVEVIETNSINVLVP